VKTDLYSFVLRKSLRYIEQHYLTLMNTSEVADFAGISECTLSREFKKFNLPGPKRLLMYCKIKHATHLMRNEELKIKQIAAMSGFTNVKRFHECFQMVFECSPGEYRGRVPGLAEMDRFWQMQGQPVEE
jgi:AraC family L-rhamnose operon transcriptional activator RhaR/AraC family L-rhamnose operon regulatory protein RhaS